MKSYNYPAVSARVPVGFPGLMIHIATGLHSDREESIALCKSLISNDQWLSSSR